MYGDFITFGEALTVAVIAMLIVFLCLALLNGVLLIFKAMANKNAKAAVATNNDVSSQNEDETELLIVLATAINAYEGK